MNKQGLLTTAAGATLALALVACGSNSNSNSKSAASPQAPPVTAASGGPASATAAAAPAASSTAAAAKPSPATPSIRRGGTLNLAVPIDAKTFDPMLQADSTSAYVTNQVFDDLVELDDSYKPTPWLADSW